MKKYLFALFLFCGVASAEKMNIVFTSDGNFGQHTCVTMASILKNSLPEDEFAFYIIDEGVQDSDKKKIENLKKLFKPFDLQYIKVPDTMKSRLKIKTTFVHERFGKLMVYLRLFIPLLLPDKDKALYLDADLYIRDTLRDFYDTNISNYYCLATVELGPEISYSTANYILNYQQQHPGKVYFNNGVVLLNLKKIRDDKTVDKLINKSNEFSFLRSKGFTAFLLNEQDVVNNVFGNKSLVLEDCKYNFSWKPELLRAKRVSINGAVIYHFNTKDKPWNTWTRHPNFYIRNILKDYFALTDLVGYAPKGFWNKIKENIRRWWVTF